MASRMSKKTRLVLVIVIIAVVALVAIVLSRNFSSPSPSDSTPHPQEAANFTLPTMTGANITLSELEGTPVVVNFWSISCAYCRQQLPYLENVAKQSGEDTKVIAINMVNNAESVQEFFADYEPTMIVALDENREVFANYCQNYSNPRGYIPFTLFVDGEGLVQYVKIGAFSSETELWNTLSSVFGITVP